VQGNSMGKSMMILLWCLYSFIATTIIQIIRSAQ